jgi:hypothetical protein
MIEISQEKMIASQAEMKARIEATQESVRTV